MSTNFRIEWKIKDFQIIRDSSNTTGYELTNDFEFFVAWVGRRRVQEFQDDVKWPQVQTYSGKKI